MTAPDAPRPRTWTTGTIVLLIVCALVAAAAITAAALLPGFVRDEPRRDAESTLLSFLDAAAAIDADWQDDASPLLRGVVPIGAPLLGESTTADALKLSVTYDIADLTFTGKTLETSDTASADIVVHYSYRVLDEKGTASIPQTVWLTRPFYYGDDQPQRVVSKNTPTAVGPWRVAGISLPPASDDDDRTLRTKFDLASDERDDDDIACYSPVKALVQFADKARIDGELASSCFLGAADGSDVIAEKIDREALIEAFPAIDEGDPFSIPPELMRVDADSFHSLRAPFTQFLIDDVYVLTFAAVVTANDDEAVRLISVQRVEGAK